MHNCYMYVCVRICIGLVINQQLHNAYYVMKTKLYSNILHILYMQYQILCITLCVPSLPYIQ